MADKMMVAYHGRRDVEQYVLAIMNIVSASPSLDMDPQKCGAHLQSPEKGWDFSGRNDAKAETPILWPPNARN